MTYRPPYFRVDDRATLLELIADHPLATFVTTNKGEIALSHVPLLARDDDGSVVLEGHLARANAQWKTADSQALASFVIANAYVSPAWYPSKRTDPRTVPTWDYVAVEARGTVRFIEDESWLAAFVERLTQSQERRVGETWSVDDAPREYLHTQYQAIVGIELRVATLTGTCKLHQNHPVENIESVIQALQPRGGGAAALAAFMERFARE